MTIAGLIQADLFASVVAWFTLNYIEFLATLTGLIYLYYSIKGKKLLWIYGIITSALYVYICFNAGIYADMGINIYYVVVSIYGLIHWQFYRSNAKEKIPVSKIKNRETLLVVLVTFLIYIVIAYILIKYTDSTIPYWDAFTTSASITATWMLARKIMEHWLIWILVDAISIGLYIYKQLYITTILFAVYTVMAVIGYIQWRKEWQSQEIIS